LSPLEQNSNRNRNYDHNPNPNSNQRIPSYEKETAVKAFTRERKQLIMER